MKRLLLIACLMAGLTTSAQEVDKAKVQAQAKAAENAQGDLKKVDTGEKAWKFSGVAGLNAAATGLVNWAAGGNNSVNGVAFGRLRLLYHKDKVAWDSNLDLEYGLSYIDQTRNKVQKSNDRIRFDSKIGYEFAKQWYATALASFNTQFANGYTYVDEGKNPVISRFMAPAYTDVSVGIDWKPNDMFSIYMSPVAGRFTTVAVSDHVNRHYADRHALGDGGLEQELKEKYSVWKYDNHNNKDYSGNTRAELGFSLKGSVNYKYKDLKVISTVGLYTPYAWDKEMVPVAWDENDNPIRFRARDNGRRTGNFDVDWDVNLSYQFLKCLQVTLSTSLKYYNGVMIADKDGLNPCERVQFKTVLGLGLGYTF